jgi:hypothetical protein
MSTAMWITIAAVGLFAFNLWLYYRSPSASTNRFSATLGLLVSAAMIVGLAPQWLRPNASRVRIAGSVASILVSLTTIVVSVRRLRAVR